MITGKYDIAFIALIYSPSFRYFGLFVHYNQNGTIPNGRWFFTFADGSKTKEYSETKVLG